MLRTKCNYNHFTLSLKTVLEDALFTKKNINRATKRQIILITKGYSRDFGYLCSQ